MNNVRLQRNLTLPNDVETIPQLNEFVELACEEIGFDMSSTMSLVLAIEEAVVNVMSYAYPEGTEGSVDINIIADDVNAIFIISDNGKPFDPTARGEVDTTLPADKRPIGGLGIHLMRQIMDDVSYERKENMNVLTLSKTINNNNQ